MNILPANVMQKIEQLVRDGFRQQDLWTCGPASVNLVLLALGYEALPELAWKDSRFEKWVPIQQFPVRGIALHELQFTSEMLFGDRFEFIVRRAFPENLGLFMADLARANDEGGSAVILNFRQDDLVDQSPGPQGNPHYSPVAGFLKDKGEILIADVDPEVKTPFRVSAQVAFKSMSELNPAFGMPRGWIVMKKRDVQ